MYNKELYKLWRGLSAAGSGVPVCVQLQVRQWEVSFSRVALVLKGIWVFLTLALYGALSS